MQRPARFTVLAVLALCAAISFSSGAADAPASSEAASGTGTVNAIMDAERRVNISHGPIPALGWPGMTMDFDLADSATTEGIKVGQRVAFRLRKRADGAYEIESLSPSTD